MQDNELTWPESEYLSADGYPVTEGARFWDTRFWDNNLRVVQVTQVAAYPNTYADTGELQTWHKTTGGTSDTLTGAMQPYGRLARFFEGQDAENHASGTNFKDVKN